MADWRGAIWLALFDRMLATNRARALLVAHEGATTQMLAIRRSALLSNEIRRQRGLRSNLRRVNLRELQTIADLLEPLLHCSTVNMFQLAETVSAHLNGSADTAAIFNDLVARLALWNIYCELVGQINRGLVTPSSGLLESIHVFESLSRSRDVPCASALLPYEALLQSDPSGIYQSLDEVARSQYRREFERVHLSRAAGGRSSKIVDELGFGSPVDSDTRAAKHENFFRRIGINRTCGSWNYGFLPQIGVSARLWMCIWLVGSLCVAMIPFAAGYRPAAGAAILVSVALTLIGAEAILVVMRHIALLASSPRPLKIDSGIAPLPPIAVVVPLLLSDIRSCIRLMRRLQSELLQTPIARALSIVLLVDRPDSLEQPAAEKDTADLLALKAFARLINKGHHRTRIPVHIVFRESIYIESERLWRGWGRKSGKLIEFNQLVVTGESNCRCVAGNSFSLRRIELVLTIDERNFIDGQSATTLVDHALHPFNRPKVDACTGFVEAGFGIVAPYSTPVFAPATPLFARSLMGAVPAGAGPITCDPNFRLFGLRQYSGKGAYWVDTAHATMSHGYNPEKTLSHDIIEGALLRVGFAPGANVCEFVEDDIYRIAARAERWIRGDFQNLLSLAKAEWRAVPKIPPFGTYLILSNAVRDMLPLTQLGLAAVLEITGHVYVGAGPVFLGFPLLLLELMLNWIAAAIRGAFFRSFIPETKLFLRACGSELLRLSLLPLRASIVLVGFGRAAAAISRKRAVQDWIPSQDSARLLVLIRTYRRLHCAASFACAAGVAVLCSKHADWLLLFAGLLWLFSPLLVIVDRKALTSKVQ